MHIKTCILALNIMADQTVVVTL